MIDSGHDASQNMAAPAKIITILGAGSWGTALALYLARRGQTVRVWSIVQQEIEDMLATRENKRYMPGFILPNSIHPMIGLQQAIEGVDDILLVVPSVGFRDVLLMIKPYIHSKTHLICATKGLDAETGQLLHDVVADIFGSDQPFAVISGPSFAKEVAQGLPCAIHIASINEGLCQDLSLRFNSPLLKTHLTDDVIGVEIGGVTKNIIAIATGIADGMALGSGARSTIITYGLAEIIKLGLALGGQLETFIGLSGIGDLILTCSDDLSRNRRFGLAVGKGASVDSAEKEIGQVVEGKQNATIILKLAQEKNITMPVCTMVSQILHGKRQPKEAMQELLALGSS